VLLILLGLFAIGAAPLFTLVAVIFCGYLLLIGGALHVASAFMTRPGSGFFVELLLGFLDAAIGLMILTRPMGARAVLTALLAIFFLAGGLFRAAVATGLQYPRWGLSVLSGLFGVVLGIVILIDWEESQDWVLGLLVGIDLLSRGCAWVATALALRGLSETLADKP
jgi:uncharacterized membrane protein HdeD (DUF308 family)